ncbi:ATP-grasp fold amidoligase family protein [Hutsoniella sourekii]
MKRFLKNNIQMIVYLYFLLRRKGRYSDFDKMNRMSTEEKKAYLDKMYLEKLNRHINWESPQRYTEKIQMSKIYDDSELKALLSDKYMVKKWVSEKIGSEYVIQTLGIYDNFDEIDFKKLPNQFVMKTNNASGTNFVVTDKGKLNINNTKYLFKRWLESDNGLAQSLELHYRKIPPKILIEEYISDGTGELKDFKFLCFDGEPKFCWVDIDRYGNHKRNIYDLEWNLQPWNQKNYGNSEFEIKKPHNFNEMIRLASILSKGFPHVRVDFYNVEGKIYFGEMTFTNGSGFEPIVPDEYDYKLGELWSI